MKIDPTLSPLPVQQAPVREPASSVSGPGQTGSPPEVRDDPFSYLPPIYEPGADFITDSAPRAIRDLLTAPPDLPDPPTDPS